MSDVEKKSETQEAAPKKKPYNLREKKEKKAKGYKLKARGYKLKAKS